MTLDAGIFLLSFEVPHPMLLPAWPRQWQRGWRGPYSWTSAGAVRELTAPAPHEPLRWLYFTSAWWDLLPLETGVLCGIRGICQLGKG